MKAFLVKHRGIRQAAIFLQITLFVLLIGNTLVARETRDISQDDLLKGVQAKTISLLLDVRTVDEFNQGHVPGAVNIPHFELEGRLAEIIAYRNKEIVVYCRSGRRTEIALTILRDSGFSKLLHLKGDIIGWLENNRPLEK